MTENGEQKPEAKKECGSCCSAGSKISCPPCLILWGVVLVIVAAKWFIG